MKRPGQSSPLKRNREGNRNCQRRGGRVQGWNGKVNASELLLEVAL